MLAKGLYPDLVAVVRLIVLYLDKSLASKQAYEVPVVLAITVLLDTEYGKK